MPLRSYQIDARDNTHAAWQNVQSVLGVAATGLGKTIIFASIIEGIQGRVLVLAHREELIFQASDKIKNVTGFDVDIEMADMRAAEMSLAGKAKVIVSTIQTQTAGRNGGRMHRFNPYEFDLVIIDEAHHAVSSSYRKVIEYYRQNKELRVLGVTATPDRTDKAALGQIFDDVAFEFDIRFGIEEGWLVPVVQRTVHAKEIDLSRVRTKEGDLNRADLTKVLTEEGPLHKIIKPTFELTRDGRKTLIFAASIEHAEQLCKTINKDYREDSARLVTGTTPKPDRRQIFSDYAEGKFQYLINVGVATEGFDEPGIEVVVMARPTKSRSLYSQIVGRGTRPLPGVVDHPDMFGSPSMRREAIAASSKPHVEIIDFVGNSGRHKLITTADILGGKYSSEVVERARANVERDGQRNMMEALDEAEAELRKEREEAEKAQKAEAEKRAKISMDVEYTTSIVDPFDTFDITPVHETGWDTAKPPTERMVAMLERQGVDTRGLTFAEAGRIIRELTKDLHDGKCSYRQKQILAARNLPTDVSREEANRMIDDIARRENWKPRKRKSKRAKAAVLRF